MRSTRPSKEKEKLINEARRDYNKVITSRNRMN